MDPVEFQKAARDAAQTTHMMAAARLAETAGTPGLDPELAIKIYNATKDTAQAVPKDKADQYANIPMFNIIMTNGHLGGVVATEIIEMQPVDIMSEMVTVTPLVPTPVMLEHLDLNLDVMDLLEGL